MSQLIKFINVNLQTPAFLLQQVTTHSALIFSHIVQVLTIGKTERILSTRLSEHSDPLKTQFPNIK